MTPETVSPSNNAKTAILTTIVVIHHQLQGYPEDCLASLGAVGAMPETEFLLVTGSHLEPSSDLLTRFPNVRILYLERGDRAAAKNLALAEARGEFVLLATADTIARDGAIEQLREFTRARSKPAIVSAHLLSENGMRRRTRYAFPSLMREANPFAWIWRWRNRLWRKGRPPRPGGVMPAPALHASFIMARREVFEQVGRFTSGYRFAHEDIEWCWRARGKGIPRYVLPNAHAFRMPPQLYGELPPAVRVAMYQSLSRLVAATHSASYAVAYRCLTKAKSLCKWMIAGLLNWTICGNSILLANEAEAHSKIWRLAKDATSYTGLSTDIESHVRWEGVD